MRNAYGEGPTNDQWHNLTSQWIHQELRGHRRGPEHKVVLAVVAEQLSALVLFPKEWVLVAQQIL